MWLNCDSQRKVVDINVDGLLVSHEIRISEDLRMDPVQEHAEYDWSRQNPEDILQEHGMPRYLRRMVLGKTARNGTARTAEDRIPRITRKRAGRSHATDEALFFLVSLS